MTLPLSDLWVGDATGPGHTRSDMESLDASVSDMLHEASRLAAPHITRTIAHATATPSCSSPATAAATATLSSAPLEGRHGVSRSGKSNGTDVVAVGGDVLRVVTPMGRGGSGRLVSWGERTLVMGILNITPDSFSDGGTYVGPGAVPHAPHHTPPHLYATTHTGPSTSHDAPQTTTQALHHAPASLEDDGRGAEAGEVRLNDVITAARRMVEAGADILDIGGQSTRPGAVRVPQEVELSRVIPVISALSSDPVISAAGTLISVDTFYAAVAHRAVHAGAHIVNDVSGGSLDPAMHAEVG